MSPDASSSSNEYSVRILIRIVPDYPGFGLCARIWDPPDVSCTYDVQTLDKVSPGWEILDKPYATEINYAPGYATVVLSVNEQRHCTQCGP